MRNRGRGGGGRKPDQEEPAPCQAPAGPRPLLEGTYEHSFAVPSSQSNSPQGKAHSHMQELLSVF